MGLIIRLPIMTNKPDVPNENLDLFTIKKGQFIAELNQNSFEILYGFTEKDNLDIYVNNLYLEKDINYNIDSNGKTINIPFLTKGDIVSWNLFKFKNKESICGKVLCGETLCGEN